jgi:hypothetical protein
MNMHTKTKEFSIAEAEDILKSSELVEIQAFSLPEDTGRIVR